MNLLSKRTTKESEETKKMLIEKIMNEEIKTDTALSYYSTTLKASILEEYIEPIFIVILIGLMVLSVFLFFQEILLF